LTGRDLEVAVPSSKLAYTVHFTSYKAVGSIEGSHVIANVM